MDTLSATLTYVLLVVYFGSVYLTVKHTNVLKNLLWIKGCVDPIRINALFMEVIQQTSRFVEERYFPVIGEFEFQTTLREYKY